MLESKHKKIVISLNNELWLAVLCKVGNFFRNCGAVLVKVPQSNLLLSTAVQIYDFHIFTCIYYQLN